MLWLLAALTSTPPDVTYTIRVDPADLGRFAIAIHVQHAPPAFGLAMFSHPEYDDHYWRYVEDVAVDHGSITRADSALWRVRGAGSDVTISYHLRLPPQTAGQRAAWKPFLTETGGLVDGPHALLYIVGAEREPARVRLVLPGGWRVTTPLRPADHALEFSARSVAALMDGPMLLGRFHDWRFALDGTPYQVAYWDAPDSIPFDTTTFVARVKGLVRQAVALFRRAPYAEYRFLFQDRAYGALEHPDAVTIGAPSADLARDVDAYVGETAHEFFHAWNLMRIHPAGYGGVDYRPRPLSTGLWVSEGFTMFYADLLARRAGFQLPDSTRRAHLERLLGRYFENPAFDHFSAERISQASYGPPLFLGDYQASTHLQGEVLAAMLDLLIRSHTAGRRSLDDVMRGLAADTAGFTTASVEALVRRECGCDPADLFAHVRRAGLPPLDVNRYLALIGLRAQVDWVEAVDDSGRVLPDERVWSYQPPPPADRPLLLLQTPAGAWGRAGLHSGDTLVTVGNSEVNSPAAFRQALRRLEVGDTVTVTVRRDGGAFTARVAVTGYRHPVVHLEAIPGSSDRTRTLLAAWEAGTAR